MNTIFLALGISLLATLPTFLYFKGYFDGKDSILKKTERKGL